MIRRPPRSTPKPSSAASDVYKRQSNNSPSFTGSVTTPALFVTSAPTANSAGVQATEHLECFQGFKGQLFTQASNGSFGMEVLGGVLRCHGSGQIIPILRASDAAGGFFQVIITNATTLTVSSGTFAGPAGSGTNAVTLATSPSPRYRLLSDGSSWRVCNVAETCRSRRRKQSLGPKPSQRKQTYTATGRMAM